jgi:4,5-DOPA dioxygenase extradiol
MPLLHMFPEADVPVLQVSMPWDLDDRELLMIGQALAPLRDEGVLLLGSGNLVHDTRLPSSERPQLPEHAVRFDAWVTDVLARGDVASLLDWMSLAPDPAACHPTPEHFRPLLIVAGAGSGDSVSFPVDGFEHGTISRRCVQFG